MNPEVDVVVTKARRARRFAVGAIAAILSVVSLLSAVGAAPAKAADGQVLLPWGSTWRWFNGALGAEGNWTAANYNHSTWQSGPAPLGWGSSEIRTNVSVSQQSVPSVLFRTSVQIADPSAASYVLDLVADDGVVVFVNGREIGRSNVVAGTYSRQTYASSTQRREISMDVPASALVSGTNTLAVATHINYLRSARVTFDAQLRGLPPTGKVGTPGWGTADWADEFDGTRLDSTKWNVWTGTYLSYDEAMIDAGQVAVRDGTLRITTSRLAQPVNKGGRTRAFATGWVDTAGKLSKQYGRWEIRAKLPQVPGKSRGIWPAFWLRDASGPGEIDLMESMGDPHNHLSTHPPGSWQSAIHQSTGHESGTVKLQNLVKPAKYIAADWHVWALEWTPSYVRVLLDGQQTWEVRTADYPWLKTSFTKGGVHLRMNTQVGHDWMGFTDPKKPEETVLPVTMQIDYVRYWSYDG